MVLLMPFRNNNFDSYDMNPEDGVYFLQILFTSRLVDLLQSLN